MSEPVPHIDPGSTYAGHMPVELYAGPLCGTQLLVDASATAITGTCPVTGEQVVYIPSELTTRKDCRIFQMQPDIPF